MESFGFLKTVCSLILECMERPWFFSIMMNGTSKGFFKSASCLCQSDALLLSLFILMEEVLTRLVKQSFEDGRIEHFFHPRGAPIISHLLYVDDLLIFVNVDKIMVKALLCTL